MAEQKLGFIGVGVMGEPMCRNMTVKSKSEMRAFDLDTQALKRLATHGVRVAQSIEDVVRESDVVFFSLPSGDALQSVVHSAKGPQECARPEQIFVDLGTTQLNVTRAIAKDLAAKGAIYFDSPVARTREAAEAGTLAITVGGHEAHFGKIQPLLEHIANDVTYCGETGSGQLLKLLNNMIVFETAGALAEAIAIAEASGLSGKFLLETLSKSSADSFVLRNHGLKSMVPKRFPERAFSVRYAMKDLDYALELGRDVHVKAEGALLAKQRFLKAIDSGWGEMYHPVISRLLTETGEPSDDS